LHIFGGNQLWGGAEEPAPPEPGVVYGGLINQRQLAAQYQRSGFLLQLQTRQEPFGITVVEGMAAGCVVIASPVGAFTELIQTGENGFLVHGDPADPEVVRCAAELIWNVSRNPGLLRNIQRTAIATPLSWETIAEVWEAHLAWLLDGGRRLYGETIRSHCSECRGPNLALADGDHCMSCGYFARHCATNRL
jgi:glycosyltransferase involved in cell wall biosynthesis